MATKTYPAMTEQYQVAEQVTKLAESELNPKLRMQMARRLLDSILDEGVTYEHFEAANASRRYIAQARSALRNLS